MEKAFDISMIASFVPTLLGYLPVTLYILAVSLLFGFLLGLLLTLPRIYRIPVLNQFAKLYISFFRGTPIMVQLFIVFYGIPALTALAGIDTSKMHFVCGHRHVRAEQRGKSGRNHQGRCEQRRPRAGGGCFQHRAERGADIPAHHSAAGACAGLSQHRKYGDRFLKRYITRFFDRGDGYVGQRTDLDYIEQSFFRSVYLAFCSVLCGRPFI